MFTTKTELEISEQLKTITKDNARELTHKLMTLYLSTADFNYRSRHSLSIRYRQAGLTVAQLDMKLFEAVPVNKDGAIYLKQLTLYDQLLQISYKTILCLDNETNINILRMINQVSDLIDNQLDLTTLVYMLEAAQNWGSKFEREQHCCSELIWPILLKEKLQIAYSTRIKAIQIARSQLIHWLVEPLCKIVVEYLESYSTFSGTFATGEYATKHIIDNINMHIMDHNPDYCYMIPITAIYSFFWASPERLNIYTEKLNERLSMWSSLAASSSLTMNMEQRINTVIVNASNVIKPIIDIAAIYIEQKDKEKADALLCLILKANKANWSQSVIDACISNKNLPHEWRTRLVFEYAQYLMAQAERSWWARDKYNQTLKYLQQTVILDPMARILLLSTNKSEAPLPLCIYAIQAIVKIHLRLNNKNKSLFFNLLLILQLKELTKTSEIAEMIKNEVIAIGQYSKSNKQLAATIQALINKLPSYNNIYTWLAVHLPKVPYKEFYNLFQEYFGQMENNISSSSSSTSTSSVSSTSSYHYRVNMQPTAFGSTSNNSKISITVSPLCTSNETKETVAQNCSN